MSTLTYASKLAIYEDANSTNNPKMRYVDWSRSVPNVPVSDPRSETYTLAPFEEKTIFSGTLSTSIDGTTEMQLITSSLSPTKYRFQHTGTGTAPAFRTDRALTLSGGDVTLTVNSNLTATVTHSSGAVFGAVVAGDMVKIRGTSTGDVAGPFNTLNEGLWIVLAATSTTLTLVRASGVFQGITETVTIANNQEFIAYSSAGIPIGAYLDINGTFVATTLTYTYEVTEVTPSYVEFIATTPLASETGLFDAADVVFYQDPRTFIRIETDQAIIARLNGDTTSLNKIVPITTGSESGWLEKWGTTYSLVVKSLSNVSSTIRVISAK